MPDYHIGRFRGGLCVTWPDPTIATGRRRYQLKATTRKEADAEARTVIAQLTAPDDGLTVSAVWDAYRKDREGRPVAKALLYSRALIAHFGHLRCDQITVEDCRSFTKARRAAGISDGTIWTELGHLRTALVWAAKPSRKLISVAVDIERPQKPDPVERWLNRAEAERLLAAATVPHIRLAITLLLTTAARVGAILELTWDRCDFERGQINLRKEVDRPRKGRAIVPMNRTARAALLGAKRLALSDHVIEWAGEPVRSIRKGFSTAADEARLPGVNLHTLRHTAAVWMASEGVPMDRIAAYLGHSNPAITAKVYARFAPEHLRDASNVLEFSLSRAVQRT